MYRRCCGTLVLPGPNRNTPAARSRGAPKTLAESGRGRHSHSTDPSGATRQLCSQLDRKPYSAMGGNTLMGTRPLAGTSDPGSQGDDRGPDCPARSPQTGDLAVMALS